MSNRTRGLFVKRLVFSFNLIGCKHEVMIAANVGTWKYLVFALLMLDLKHLGIRMKSIWLWTCSLEACQVLDNLWGWRVLSRVSRWLFANSRSLYPLSSLQSQIFRLSLPVVGMLQAYFGIPIALNYKCIPLGSLCYDARRTVRPPHSCA